MSAFDEAAGWYEGARDRLAVLLVEAERTGDYGLVDEYKADVAATAWELLPGLLDDLRSALDAS